MNRILLTLTLLFSIAAYAQRPVKSAPNNRSVSQTSSSVSGNISAQQWEEQEAYINGFARVMRQGKFSFIDINGTLVTAVQFEDARNFSNKLAAVKKDGKWGFINEKAATVIPFKYDIVFDFKETVTGVYADKKWTVINTNGEVVFQPAIDLFYGFKNGIARVVKDGNVGMMNITGEISFTGERIATNNKVKANRSTASTVSTPCPDNIDFENGNFNNWNCFIGTADSIGNTNVITVSPSAPVANRHRVYAASTPSAIDPFGMFPTNPPDGSNFAVKLGNTRIGAEAERIQYVIHVPLNDSNFSIKYDYAVVFQDPGHTAWTQPRFTAKLYDSAAQTYIDCASFEYISTSNLPGFQASSVDTSVIYKPWASAYISLRGHAGQTLYLEFTTADCVRRGHWGYAYVDVENTCGQSITLNYQCQTGIATLDGPPGFQTYNWWNQDYTAILATGEHASFNPGNNSTVWLELIPFNDFGCRDSMAVNINSTFTPHFDVSDTVGVCAPHSFTFYNTALPSASANWDFGDGHTGSGDTVTHVYQLPGVYHVSLTVTLSSGCTGTYQGTVTVVAPTATLDYSGGNFCNGTTVDFTVNSSAPGTIVYDFGDGTTISTTQTTIAHTYTTAGIYLPTVTVTFPQGCNIVLTGTDPIKIELLHADFTTTAQSDCGSSKVHFTSTSTSNFGIAQYNWNFGDGHTGTGAVLNHTYTASGTYNVQLIIEGANGCRDTMVKPVVVTILELPVAIIDNPGTVCLHNSITFTSSTQSADAIADLLWESSDNTSGVGTSFTATYTQTGNYTIQLIAVTVNGCADTATTTITLNELPDVTQPEDTAVCTGVVVNMPAFSSSVSGTTFTWINDDTSIGLAASGTGDLPSFTSSNTTAGSITANISVTPTANGCIGFPKTIAITVYPVPSVFRPTDQVVCNRGTTDAVIFNSFTSATASANITWTNDDPSIGLAATGSGNIPAFTAVNNSGAPVTAHITISIANNGCNGVPQTFSITVNPTPDMAQPAMQSLCNGATSNAVQYSSTVSNAVYTWTNSMPSIGLAASGSDAVPAFNAINNSNAPVTATITASSLAYGCYGTPAVFNITVNPTPTVDQPASQSVCTGSATTAIQFSGAVAGTTYNWTNDLPAIGIPANGTGNLLSFNPNNNGNANLVANISVAPSANGCTGTPKDFSITVYPVPGMIQPLNQYLCNGETTVAMNFIGTVAGTSFTWTNSLPSIGLAASGTGTVPPFVTNNPTNSTVTAAFTVTPSTGNCPGTPKTFYLTIDPTPVITQPANLVVCDGETVNIAAFTGSVIGTSYTWINSAAQIGIPAAGTGDIPVFTAHNDTYFPITAIIQVTGSANSCGSDVKIFTITVNPTPAIDEPMDQAVCNGIATNGVPLTGPVSGTVFSWKNDHPSIGLPAIGTGDIPSFIAINTTNAPIVASIIITGTNVTCGAVLDTMTITVNPSAAVQANNNQVVCQGSSVQLQASGATQYSWTPSAGLSCTNCANPQVTPADSIWYKVKGISMQGCAGYDSVLLAVQKPFQMRTPPNDTVCLGRSANLSASNAATYVWSPAAGLDNPHAANPVATPVVTTQYQVVGYDAYHCFTDTARVTIAVGPQPSVHIGGNISAQNGTSTTFTPTITGGPITQYTWTPANELSCTDCPNPTANIHTNVTYALTVVNSFGCSAVDSVFVSSFCQKAEVFVPNAFTPDGDGLNDILMIRGTGIQVKSFRVFNRWGVLVFERQNFVPNDSKYGWDGKVRGVPATPDVYVYTAEVVCDNGTVYTYKGNTTILK
ncbi:MAG: PKD domain-containing protein [Bacteroidetes bacterium]|nr:PKD domain-containing protein [Bacteroidota bacterium]